MAETGNFPLGSPGPRSAAQQPPHHLVIGPPHRQRLAGAGDDPIPSRRPAADGFDMADADHMRAVDADEALGVETRQQRSDRASVEELAFAAIEADIFAFGADPVE